MAAIIDSFEPFRTPNLVDASIAADSNHMDGYFNDKMDIEKNDYFDPESWTLFPPDQRQSDVDEANDFTMPSDEFTYPNIVTPPPSAKEAPADWAFQPMKSEANFFANPLHQIDTTQNTLNARFDWGQPTPPDDVGSPGCQFPAPATTSIKQESEEAESKSAISRRKKSTDNAEGQPKRRRSRKSVSAASSATISSNPDASGEPQDEDRRNRFLERNRVAASKCRQKKKEWTQNLESHARDLHANNHQLQVLVGSLKDEVMYLRTEMLRHGSCECTGIREYLAREADMLAAGTSPRTPGSQHRSSLSSAVSSPRQSVASVPNFNLDPTLRKKATESQKKSSKSSAGRADSVSSNSST